MTVMSVPAFGYAIAPTSVLVSQVQQLVLTVTNTSGSAVSCGLDLNITVSIPVGAGASDLVTAAGAPNVTAAPQDPNWSQNVDYDENAVTIQIFPARATSLPANGQLVVLIAPVAVNAVASTPGATLTVQASDNTGSGGQQSLSIAKVSAGQSISAYANPVGMGQGQSTTIFWSATGGSHVQLSLNGQVVQDTPFQGSGPVWSGSFTKVKPYPNTPQTTYVVTVLNTSGSSTSSTSVVIGLEPPAILHFDASKQTGLMLHESVDLSWDTQYGAAAYLTASSGGGSLPVNLQETALAVEPSDWIAGTPNASSVSASLSVTGYLGPALRNLRFAFAPAAIEYFSYASMTPSDGVAAPVVVNGTGQLVSGAGNSWTLNVVGPGGPLTRSIGSEGPSVNYFGPAGTVLSAPGDVTLSYWVNGMKSGDTLTLNGSAVAVDSAGKGSTVVSPTSTTTYTLLAVLSGQSILNTLSITVSSQAHAQDRR
jgi:hypothetical protein